MEFDQHQMEIEAHYSTASENIGEPVDLELKPCPICTRTFIPATLAKHVKICEKMAMKKRKQFDSSRQRREGTDLADFLPKNFGLPPSKVEPKTSPKVVQSAPIISPRKEEEPPKQTIIALTKASPPVVSQPKTGWQSTPLREKEKPKIATKRLATVTQQCPFCERSFGTKAYERHVEWCKEKSLFSNKRNSSSQQKSIAKERLEARNKYRPPCLKTKRAVNREKYSGFNCGESTNSLSDGGNNGTTKLSPEEHKMSMSTSLSSSIMSDGFPPKISLEEKDKMFKTFSNEGTSEDISTQSSPSSLKKQPATRLTQIQRPSIPNIKSSKASKAKEASFEHFMTLSEEGSTAKQKKFISESSEDGSYRNVVNANQENFELTVTACNKKYPITVGTIANRTGPKLTNSEDENSNKEVTVPDDPITESTNTQGAALDSETSAEYTSYDDIPVESSKVSNTCEEINYISQEENNQDLKGQNYNDQNDEAENSSLSLYEEFNSNTAMKRFSLQKSKSEELDPDIAEFYSYAPECAKSYIEEENSTQEEVNKKTAGDSEFFDCSLNNFTLSLQEDDDDENIPNISRSTSFIISGLSDKYDPFLSAKRQLEDLCSPTYPTTPAISPMTTTAKQRTTSLSSSLSSSSNPRNTLNNVKSNFRRTSSLRCPRKASARPIFITPTLQKPTIQRGLSDEGPISTNFLKPEEYDEMPVKSVCINDFAFTHSPKVIKRDINSNANRRNLRLNLNKINDKPNGSTALSKTDSLAVFLKYENETKHIPSPIDLSEKDLKDKTNILSKQTSQKSLNSSITPLTDKETVSSLKDSLANLIESKSNFIENSKNMDQTTKPLLPSKTYPIRLEPLPKTVSPKLSLNYSLNEISNNVNLSSILDFKDNDYIDPKLINVCDNLPVNVSKLSDSDLTSSSTDSASTTKIVTECPSQLQRQSQYQQFHQTSSNRNSTERKNLLKRQMRLGKNQFLYDMSPDSDPYSEECDKTISMIESSAKLLDSSLNEPSFDDFDFEEFLSSFEHDEDQFPIFKDCKEFLLNRSFNKRCNNLSDPSARSPTTMNMDYENDDGKREIFISIETNQNENSPSPTEPLNHPTDDEVDKNANKVQKIDDEQTSGHDEKQDNFDEIIDINRNNARNIMKKMEREFIQNDSSLEHEANTAGYPMDSDEISSGECYPISRNTKSKQSADSAYGSLSRHSPTDQRSLRNNQLRIRQQSSGSIPEQQPPKLKYLQKNDSKQRNRDLSASSSGSDTSLPPIQPLMEKEKHYYGDELLQSKDIRMSKFCHECGSKFFIPQAKFCMECGVKRMVLD